MEMIDKISLYIELFEVHKKYKNTFVNEKENKCRNISYSKINKSVKNVEIYKEIS